MANEFWFLTFPYIAVTLAIGFGFYRYYTNRFSFSSLSSQILENRSLFWGSIPWHYGIVLILLAHFLAIVIPDFWVFLHRNPLGMLVIGLIDGALGLLALLGILVLIIRRIADAKTRAVTTVMDWILLFDFLLQVAAGVYIALFNRWGTLWYEYTATPWLASLATLSPKIDSVTSLPWIVRFHMVNAFVLIGLFPFTRLVHIFTVPISYLWRPYQVAIWNRTKRAGGNDGYTIEKRNREVGC